MRSAEPPHIEMEILGGKKGTLPFPNSRRNTSLPNLETHKVLTKCCHDGNTTETCFRYVSVVAQLCQHFVKALFTSRFNRVSVLEQFI